MGETESLWVILGVIYLAECLVWIRRDHLAFGAWWPGRFHLWYSDAVLANEHGGFGLANPLPPLGTVFVAAPWPFTLSPQAVYGWSAACLQPGGRPPQSGRFIPFDQVKTVRVETRRVLVNDLPLVKARSPQAARRLARLLEKLRTTPEPARADAIRQALRATFDSGALRARLEAFGRWDKRLRLPANVLFFYLFVLAPWLCWTFSFRRVAWGLAAGLFLQTISLAFLFRRAHRDLYPQADDERFSPFCTMLLAAPSAIRAGEVLALPLLESFHPLAVATELGAQRDPSALERAFRWFHPLAVPRELAPPALTHLLAGRTLRDLRYPLLPDGPIRDPAALACQEWFRSTFGEVVEEFVRRNGFDPEELLRAPRPREPVNRTYCPRCYAQFMLEQGTCPDCGGRELAPLATGLGIASDPEKTLSK